MLGFKNFGDLTPLYGAIKDDFVDMAKLLVNRGADIEAGLRATPLHMAVINGSTDATSFLLSSGANVEARDDSGRTPLMHASCGKLEIVQLLLRFRAFPRK